MCIISSWGNPPSSLSRNQSHVETEGRGVKTHPRQFMTGGGMLRIVWEKQYQAISWGQGYLGAVYYNLAGACLVYGGRCRYITTTSQFSPTYISQHLHQFIFEIVMKWFVFPFHRHHHPHHNLVICPKPIGHTY